ncbi:hypothetical protein L1887_21374 [Cichorium endivia]|nr:hypothetical protein L1887_21374 [Cichorium endivia]
MLQVVLLDSSFYQLILDSGNYDLSDEPELKDEMVSRFPFPVNSCLGRVNKCERDEQNSKLWVTEKTPKGRGGVKHLG